jgi:glycosyltransferase involved in cell wall biosynthesis
LLRIPHLVGTATSFWVDYYTTTFGLPRVVVMPNPVLLKADLPPRQVSDRMLQVLFLTRLEVEKGAWEYVGAIEQCLAAGVTIRFVVAGDGSLLEEVRTRLAPYMSTGLVHVHGWVTEEEKERLFLESDVYVLPTYVEVLSVAMLQAMTHRLAIIVTDVCGNSDAVQNGVSGWLVPPQNVSQIADGILRLDRDRPLLARMANTAFEKCRQTYSLDAVLAQHMEAFRRLIGPRTDGGKTRPNQP